ncbi:MAG: hypothetical protein EB058_12555, partial [Proteobacteria bacterium]|nr:hypothetical protein [Pseudomonadota bacterium]
MRFALPSTTATRFIYASLCSVILFATDSVDGVTAADHEIGQMLRSGLGRAGLKADREARPVVVV